MQGPLRLFAVLSLSTVMLSGCGRKTPEPTAQNQPETEAPSGSTSTTDSQPGKASPAAQSGSAGTGAQQSGNVSPELAKSDELYDAWFRKYNLDLNDPDMLDADPDGDGVANRDEFLADTDPRDRNSLPNAAVAGGEAHAALRLKQYNEVRVPVVLDSVEGGSAKIRHTDGGDKVETVRAGQTLAGTGLKVEKVQPRRITDKHGAPVDASRVTLEDTATKEKMVLVKNMPTRSAASYAVLTSEDGKSSITVRQGDSFAWPQDGGSTFKVIDLRADQAVLQEESSGKMYTVTKQ